MARKAGKKKKKKKKNASRKGKPMSKTKIVPHIAKKGAPQKRSRLRHSKSNGWPD